MNTEILRIDKKRPDVHVMQRAGEILKKGGLVAFPTETVYGLGGDALNPESSRRIYAAKGRPSDNPLIVHICCMEDLNRIVKKVPWQAERLAEAFWPGPLTIIFEKADVVPVETTGGLHTVAVRMPDHPIAQELIRTFGGYIAAPSANASGKPSPTLAKYVEEDLAGKIDMILDGGPVGIGLESTIIDWTADMPIVLRPGAITLEMLEDVLGQVDMDQTILSDDSGQAPKAPGMKYRHYAPRGELVIVEGEASAVTEYINTQTATLEEKGEKVGIIGTDASIRQYLSGNRKSAGSREEEESIAKELYRILREFDDEQVTMIFSEAFERKGIGQAIMNRLLKAAGHKVIKL